MLIGGFQPEIRESSAFASEEKGGRPVVFDFPMQGFGIRGGANNLEVVGLQPFGKALAIGANNR